MSAPERPVTVYLRNVPRGLVRQAKMKAARDGTTLTAVVIEAVARSCGTDTVTRTSADDPLQAAMAWYDGHRTRLVRRYRNQYVAIVGGAVVDHDASFDALATRVFDRFGARPVFMPKVTARDEPVRVRSPRRRVS